MSLFNKYNFEIERVADKNSVRPELDGIFITPKETVVTDSFRLITVSSIRREFPDKIKGQKVMKNFEPQIITKKHAKEIKKMLPRKTDDRYPDGDKAVVLESTPDIMEVGTRNLNTSKTLRFIPIEGDYPRYQKMMGKPTDRQTVLVDIKLLSDLIRFFKKFTKDNTLKDVKIMTAGKDKPIMIEAKNEKTGQTAKSMLMPIQKG